MSLSYPTEHIWLDVDRVFCDPVNDGDGPPEQSLVVPPGHLYRAAVRRSPAGCWEQTVPRYLFRGEPDCFENTWTSLWRLLDKDRNLGELDKARIIDAKGFVMECLRRQVTEHRMSHLFAEGCCQHYGLPTGLIDFTSSLDIAAYFATHTTQAEAGRIGVLDLQEARQFKLVDLTKHPWALRPRNQAAYGVRHSIDWPAGADYKGTECCSDLSLTWYQFRHTAVDQEGVIQELAGRSRGLLDASTDVMAGLILLFLDEYIEMKGGPLSREAAEWLAKRVPHTPLAKCFPVGGSQEEFWLATWAQTGRHYSENEIRAQSIRVWCGELAEEKGQLGAPNTVGRADG
jgi:hypothetical protein